MQLKFNMGPSIKDVRRDGEVSQMRTEGGRKRGHFAGRALWTTPMAIH